MAGRTLGFGSRRYPKLRKLEKLYHLPLRDKVLLAQLAAGCCAIAIALRMVGWQRLAQFISARSHSKWLRHLPLFHLSDDIEHLSSMANVASGPFPRNRCLVRSMALLWLLRTRGEPAEVVLGVRKREGNFEAHAWTLSEQGLIGDHAEAIAEFAVMTTSGTSRPL
jgi:hypothetical protein